MPSGQINVSNCGIYFISAFFIQIFTGRSIGPKLTKALSEIGAGAYQKGRADMYQVLKPYMETGIANARKLNQINKEKTPVNSKPGD